MGSIRLKIRVNILLRRNLLIFDVRYASIVIIIEFIFVMNCNFIGPNTQVSARNQNELSSKQISNRRTINRYTENFITEDVYGKHGRN